MSQSGSQHVDTLIIGGGPAGLTCAISLARYRRNVIVVDSMESRAALIPEEHNYPGFADGIAGPQLLEALTTQAEVRDTAFVATHSQTVLSAEKVVLASGLIDRSGPVAGLDEAVEERLVRYCPICGRL
jgi:thioredoxin reductase (NADPH)